MLNQKRGPNMGHRPEVSSDGLAPRAGPLRFYALPIHGYTMDAHQRLADLAFEKHIRTWTQLTIFIFEIDHPKRNTSSANLKTHHLTRSRKIQISIRGGATVIEPGIKSNPTGPEPGFSLYSEILASTPMSCSLYSGIKPASHSSSRSTIFPNPFHS